MHRERCASPAPDSATPKTAPHLVSQRSTYSETRIRKDLGTMTQHTSVLSQPLHIASNIALTTSTSSSRYSSILASNIRYLEILLARTFHRMTLDAHNVLRQRLRNVCISTLTRGRQKRVDHPEALSKRCGDGLEVGIRRKLPCSRKQR